MKRLSKIFLYFLCAMPFLQCVKLHAQELKLLPFELQGTINADTGTVKLRFVADTAFYAIKETALISARIVKGKFSIKGGIPYPQGMSIEYNGNGGYSSSVFIIEPGVQAIEVNVNTHNNTPKVGNAAMLEYANGYLDFTKQIVQMDKNHMKKYDSLNLKYNRKIPVAIAAELQREMQQIYDRSDENLLEYVKVNPNSYYAFWRLLRLSSFGYESVFDAIFFNFSEALKNTYSGKSFSKRLETAAVLSKGKKFPGRDFKNIQGKQLDVSSFLKEKYTLVDFWYSACHPCISQFPHLNKLYAKYRTKGFEIIGISTDKERDKEDWIKGIKKHKILWPQYWDKNGIESAKLSILAFPTNYLLDHEGRIVMKNIKPDELEVFLQVNIK
ncbi:Alkyl hydroperoxide reductase subunit AhpC (peroxiredoxin) [Pedobacter steynii]|uniref:Alkyl hydroperoxide reductase subunit AhpC (Peroxiredoxin) n=1 Tax=Pedobacter steynii TaxID=430522 RepID=A0A1H0HK31_9SPHI|nr:TlpA disulfide reductase family protein [Pedobacter steynii]NQX42591.1 redoxin domain-containing protein [Pedobacter steynii]SDO19404.1 Alkyl hydroperoxide reductase subunit AhpC (peroxiredoxin) [Pedobacter steynii]